MLNERLKKLCMEPEEFSKVRYMLHSLDTDRMQALILEICEVNPYLAILSYNTAETDEKFICDLKEQLYGIPIKNLHFAIMYAIALSEIGEIKEFRSLSAIIISKKYSSEENNKYTSNYRYRNGKFNEDNSKKIRDNGHRGLAQFQQKQIEGLIFNIDDWNNESFYWVDLFFKCILRNNSAKVSQFVALINRNKNNLLDINNYSDEILETGKNLLNRSIPLWLEYIDQVGLFGKIKEMGFTFQQNYKDIIYFKYNDNRNDRCFESVRKITAIGLKNGELTVGQIESYTNNTTVNKELRRTVEKTIHYFNNSVNRQSVKNKRKNEFVSKYWDIEKNGLPLDEFFYSKDDDKVWLKCACGYSFRVSFNSSTIKCTNCGKVIKNDWMTTGNKKR